MRSCGDDVSFQLVLFARVLDSFDFSLFSKYYISFVRFLMVLVTFLVTTFPKPFAPFVIFTESYSRSLSSHASIDHISFVFFSL